MNSSCAYSISRTATWFVIAATILICVPAARANAADRASWDELRNKGQSFVFGRLEGRFDGPQYRGQKIRVRETETNEEHLIKVEKGLGYFHAILPTGRYALVSLESMYFPRMKPMNPRRYPPVRQRYTIRPMPRIGLPSFPVVTESPLYLGTIRSSVRHDGMVYQGHSLEIYDDYDGAVSHMNTRLPTLMASLEQRSVTPERFFFISPSNRELPATELVTSIEDPVLQAREYIREGKHQQAINWLMTFMPANDEERQQMQLLIGEASLSEKRYDDAIENIGEALRADPTNLRALRLLARSHMLNGNREDAIPLYESLLESEPEDAEASLHAGFHYALSSDRKAAHEKFEIALSKSDDFDYLLYDLMPYALALNERGAEYLPPEPRSGFVRAPSTLRTRRDSGGGLAVLVDHEGQVVAAHVAEDSNHWASAVMMSMIRGEFKPARLNDVPIPCLIILGPGREGAEVK